MRIIVYLSFNVMLHNSQCVTEKRPRSTLSEISEPS